MTTARRAAQDAVTTEDVTDWWSTSISDIEPGVIRLRGYPVESLIGTASFPATIWLLLRGELPAEHQARLLELALVAAVDHGPQAPSIAAARMAATCGVGLNSAMATGVNLLGDTHGGAGQQCMEVLAAVRHACDAEGVPVADAVRMLLAEYKSARRFVPGFGHRFHPRDPRRDPLLSAVESEVTAGRLAGGHLEIALEIEAQLATGRPRPVPMNIDGATAVIYSELGFEPELGRGLFVLSRSVGILAHAWEERGSGRRIKGPIPPPLLPTYRGPEPRKPQD
ncbi:citryl-CoA lyase [Cryptosporangium aurantiacum]|uniref:citrate synthase (unknown stereospecificity) n=1 Tax=Cryptosporangium aurantiacum TaxID=134849 RepID=A0A1M7PF25_9ACTN|nr:citryl-CoA lyase [Cryptosporangium aurantiacum]SHN15646.1 citrate synthase [Cryptosporangium aurantiacum]